MTMQDSIDNSLRELGFRLLSDEPAAGLIGVRKRVEKLGSGETFVADIVDTRGDELLRGLSLTAEHAKSFDATFVIAPVGTTWSGDIYCQILAMDNDWVPLSRLSRDELAATPQRAMSVALGAVKCVEYLARAGVCHLAICPSTVYKKGDRIRLGEMWTIQQSNQVSYHPEFVTPISKFIRNDARLLTAPEFRDNPADIGTAADLYSLALLIANLFSTEAIQSSEVIEFGGDVRALLSQRCPGLDAVAVGALAGALERDVRKRPHIIQFQESVAGLAEAMGVPVPERYFEKSVPSPWDSRRPT